MSLYLEEFLKEAFHDMAQNQAEKMNLKPYRDTYEFLTTKKGEEAMSNWTREVTNQAIIDQLIGVVQRLLNDGYDKQKAINVAVGDYGDERFKNDFLKQLDLALQ